MNNTAMSSAAEIRRFGGVKFGDAVWLECVGVGTPGNIVVYTMNLLRFQRVHHLR